MVERDPRTVAAANGIASDDNHGAVTPPVYLTSTFAFTGFEKHRGYEYSRTANPGRDLLADTLAKLEGAAGAVVTSSGMAAVDLVLSLAGTDDLVVAPHDCYGGTYRLLLARRDRGHFDLLFVDQSDATALASALACKPSLVLIETPSNPLMRVVDIRAVARQAKDAGARVVVDNTFLSPALQRPIPLGADFVVHSTTKYLNGHSDVIGGAVVCAAAGDAEKLRAWANITGVTGSPFDAYLTLRGLRTLFPRIEQQQANAAAIATFLSGHPAVSAVHYPGLPSHPGHAIAKAQQTGFGAMLSFELAGGVESLVAHPATMTHAGMGEEARRAAGIGDGLLRLSVGLEAEVDLIADVQHGLMAAEQAHE
jgi:cystathionine gamma-synthase